MKRFLSIILALTMIFSASVFAAPSMVGTVETSSEVTDYEAKEVNAEVQSETADANIYDDTYGLLVAKIDFESSGIELEKAMTSGTNLSTIGYTAPNLPAGFPEGGICLTFSGTSLVPFKNEDGTNTYGLFTKTAGKDGYCKIGFRGENKLALPEGTYTFKVNIKTLTKNGVEIAADTALENWTSDVYLAKANGVYGDECNYLTRLSTSTTDTLANGHWLLTHSYSFLDGEKYKLNGYKNETDTPHLNVDFNGVSAVIAMFNAGGTNGYTYEMDDFELYYKAPVTVSFNNGGVADAVLVGADGEFKVSNGAAVNTSTYSYKNTADKLFTGWRDQNGNSVWGSVNPTEDLVLTAQWIDAYDENYGTLVASLDFEKYAMGTALGSSVWFDLSAYGAVPEKLPAGFPDKIYFGHTGNTSNIVGQGSDKYLSLYATKAGLTGNQSWPRIHFRASKIANDSTQLFPEGEYTFIWTLKHDTENSKNCTVSLTSNNIYHWHPRYNQSDEMNGGYNKSAAAAMPTSEKEGWTTVKGVASRLFGETFTLSDASSFDNDTKDKTYTSEERTAIRTIDFSGYASFQAMPTVTAVSADDADAASKTYTYDAYTFIDNVKLYYKAPVTVTFADPDGYVGVDELPSSIKAKPGAAVTLPTITASEDNAHFIGWSTEKDGVVITASSFTADEDTILYAVWATGEDHEKYGKMLFNIDFENVDSISYVDQEKKNLVKHYGYVNTDDANSSNWFFTLGSFDNNSVRIYSENKDGQTIYINGEKQVSDQITDYVVANRYLGGLTNGRWPQLQVKSTTQIDTNTDNDFAPEGYYTLFTKTAYHYGVDENGKEPNTMGVTPAYQFRPTTFYPAGTTNSDGAAVSTSQDNLYSNSIHTGAGEKPAEDEWHYRGSTSTGSFSITTKLQGVEYDFRTGVRHFLINYDYGETGLVTGKIDLLKFDDIVAYWKPYTANITINMNGNIDKTVDAYVHDTIAQLDLDKLAEHVGDTKNYELVGFSKTADGEVLSENFWANEDMTLYAVWEAKSDVAPTSYDVSSIRTSGYTGIRFMASVTQAQKEEVTEYGFIVSLESLLGGKELTHDCGVNYVEGVNYGVVDGEEINKIYKTEGDDIFFTAVVYGIPESKANYEANFVVRPYTKRGDYYYYGDNIVKNVAEVARALKDGGYAKLSESDIAFVDRIIAVCDGTAQ